MGEMLKTVLGIKNTTQAQKEPTEGALPINENFVAAVTVKNGV